MKNPAVDTLANPFTANDFFGVIVYQGSILYELCCSMIESKNSNVDYRPTYCGHYNHNIFSDRIESNTSHLCTCMHTCIPRLYKVAQERGYFHKETYVITSVIHKCRQQSRLVRNRDLHAYGKALFRNICFTEEFGYL